MSVKNVILGVLDAVFYCFAVFILSFTVLNYFLPRKYSFCYSLLFSALCLITVCAVGADRKEKRAKKKEEEDKKSSALCSLCLLPKPQATTLFAKAFSKKGYETEKNGYSIVLPQKKLRVFLCFSFDGMNKADVVRAYNRINKSERAVIFTNEISEEVKNFCLRFGEKVNVMGKDETYELLSDTDCIPENAVDCLAPKIETKKRKFFFDKKRSKKYFLFGASFLLLSFIAPLKIYYTVCGFLFMTLAVISRAFGKTNSKDSLFYKNNA